MESGYPSPIPNTNGSWIEPCPRCNAPADCRYRPDTKRYAELRCPACRHFRWLPEPIPAEVECGFTVIVDTREQIPYGFSGIRDKSIRGHKPTLIIPTKVATLTTGDYSILGYEDSVAVERKSKADLYQSVAHERGNFVEKFERMESFDRSFLVVEASWDELLTKPPEWRDSRGKPCRSGLKPHSLSQTLIAWTLRYKCKLITAPNRDYAERMTFRLLQRFWLDKQGDKDA